jgi:CBS domain-containing protein
MSPRTFSDNLVRDCAVLSTEDRVDEATQRVLDSGLPALPVQGSDGRFCGIFGEREFFAAVFPGYLGTLQGAGFVTRSLDSALEKRSGCRLETVGQHMTAEHVDVGTDFSDAQIAETFLHHRVLIVPVVDDGRVTGVITRRDFFRAVAERFLAGG